MGQKVKPNYVAGNIAQTMNIFFSDIRHLRYPSLKHTPNKGCLLSGKKGIGKTLEFDVLNKFLKFDPNSNRQIKIMSVLQIEEQYKIARDQKKGAEFIDDIVNIPELMIDDLEEELKNAK
jgi:hypothetical protein